MGYASPQSATSISFESVISSSLSYMDSRITYYGSLTKNIDREINRLTDAKASLDKQLLQRYSNDLNPELFGNLSLEKRHQKSIEVYSRERVALESVLREMRECRKQLASIDITKAKDANLSDGTINGFHPLVQRTMALDAAFNEANRHAGAASWKLAVAENLQGPSFRSANSPTFTKQEATDIAERGLLSISDLENGLKRFTVEGGSKLDYANDSDAKKLRKNLNNVRELLEKTKQAAESNDLHGADRLLHRASFLQQTVEENYNRVLTEAMQKKYVTEEGTTYEQFKYKVAQIGDWVAMAAPVVTGSVGAFAGGPAGAAAGAKIGADVTAPWWFYRGVDGMVTAAVSNQVYSLEFAQSAALAFLSLTHIPGASQLKFIKPLQNITGAFMAGSVVYSAGYEIIDAKDRGWFFTHAQRQQFAFYGGMVVFTAAGALPPVLAAEESPKPLSPLDDRPTKRKNLIPRRARKPREAISRVTIRRPERTAPVSIPTKVRSPEELRMLEPAESYLDLLQDNVKKTKILEILRQHDFFFKDAELFDHALEKLALLPLDILDKILKLPRNVRGYLLSSIKRIDNLEGMLEKVDLIDSVGRIIPELDYSKDARVLDMLGTKIEAIIAEQKRSDAIKANPLSIVSISGSAQKQLAASSNLATTFNEEMPKVAGAFRDYGDRPLATFNYPGVSYKFSNIFSLDLTSGGRAIFFIKEGKLYVFCITNQHKEADRVLDGLRPEVKKHSTEEIYPLGTFRSAA